MSTSPSTVPDRFFREQGNQFTKWKLEREDSLTVTLVVVESLGLVGRELTVDHAKLKERFKEVSDGN